MTNSTPVRVLFVCLGNICRSPMAEAVFCHLVVQTGLAEQITADSAGTGDWHLGHAPHVGTQRVLRERGIDYTHAARQVTLDDFQRFDYIVALDSSNLRDLQRLGQVAHTRVGMLMDYAPQAGVRDVPDPYYTGGFNEVYELVEQACLGLLAHIVNEHQLTVDSVID